MEKQQQASSQGFPDLQVMVCVYGQEGLERLANAVHPNVEGVEYLVSCQNPNDEDLSIPKALDRDDFRIFTSHTKGLSVNRNIALSMASAPLLLISDDDVDYSEEGLRSVIEAFRENPNADMILFRYDSTYSPKTYPEHPYSIARRPMHFISSIEIAFRRSPVQGHIWFNENFGIGATFSSGEEDIFIRDCLDSGLKALFIPIVITRHDSPTTSGRNLMNPARPAAKGAVFLRLHPSDWPLRMLSHALRELPLWRKGLVPSPISYCRNWLKGVRLAKNMNVFPTLDYSSHYTCHDKSRE